MNQANQRQVVQQANMTLISIRSAEIAYFTTFFSNFGTQCALLIGFICGSISQVPGIDNPSGCHYFWIVLYWVTSAITVGSALHVLVCTVFITVFGQGFALRGPLGSMIKAIEGMVQEQKQVLWSFIVTILAFAFQAIGMYWIMMDSTSAIASTVVTLVGVVFWYNYTIRIYNRFNWNKLKEDYYNERDPQDEFNELDPNLQFDKARARAKRGVDGDDNESPTNLKSASVDSRASKSRLVDMLGFGSRNVSRADATAGEACRSSPLPSVRSASPTPFYEKSAPGSDSILSEEFSGGFITIHNATRTFLTDPWQRRYLVVRGTLIFYYKDKRKYQLFPQKPINQRPIDLDGYTLIAGGGSVDTAYHITLTPIDPDDIRKVWKFRCDTAAEFNTWLDIFSRALKACENRHSQSDFVRIPTGSLKGGAISRLSAEMRRGGGGREEEEVSVADITDFS